MMKDLFGRTFAIWPLLSLLALVYGCGQNASKQPTTPSCDEILQNTAGLATQCTEPNPTSPPPSQPEPEESWAELHDFQPSVSTYSGCEDLSVVLGTETSQGHWRRYAGRKWIDGEVIAESAAGPVRASGNSSVTKTNRQVEGVDEADQIKFVGNYAVVAQHHQMIIIDTDSLTITDERDHDLPSLAEPSLFLQTSPLPDRSRFLPTATNWDVQLFVYEDQIIQLLSWRHYYTPDRRIRIRVFTLDIAGHLHLTRESWQQGDLVTSRLLDGQLFVVANRSIEPDFEADLDDLSCGDFAQASVNLRRQDLVRISRLDLRTPDSDFDNLALPGRVDELYMSKNHLYLTQKLYYFHNLDAAYNFGRQTTIVTKVGWGDDLQVRAVGEFSGHVYDQWALNEMVDGQGQEYLVAAATRRFGWSNQSPPQENYLWVLTENGQRLEAVGSVSPYGIDENIRSVRYIGDKVYVVTFRTTDPLFGFSLADPRNPRIIDELKIPGFSSYLHPVGDNRLVGVGFDAFEQNGWVVGPKVSLFDISDGGFRELDSKSFGDRGSWSEAASNHHAFYWDATHREFAIPLVEIGNGAGDRLSSSVFSGAVVLAVDGDQLVERARVSHADWISASCKEELARGQWWSTTDSSYDINRILRIGDELLTFSRYGVRTFDRSSEFDKLRELALPVTDGRYFNCQMGLTRAQ